MMGNEEIKKANRKALPKFIVLCIAAALVGGVMGYFAAANGIDGLSGSIKAAGLKFGMFVAPWIMVAIAVIMPVVLVPYYKKAKKQLLMWDGFKRCAYNFIFSSRSILFMWYIII